MSSTYVHTAAAGIAASPDPAPDRVPADAAPECFHCGLPVPAGTSYRIVWEGAARALCCAGCEAVAHAIAEGGLDDYYRFRTRPPVGAAATPRASAAELEVYDHPAVQASFVRGPSTRREAALILEDITCAACVWLNEQQLRRLPGVHEVRVNYATRRAHVAWDDTRVHLSGILAAVDALGYRARPYDP